MGLSANANLNLIWEAENGIELMLKAAEQQPDVLLMDISMPEMDGIEAITPTRQKY